MLGRMFIDLPLFLWPGALPSCSSLVGLGGFFFLLVCSVFLGVHAVGLFFGYIFGLVYLGDNILEGLLWVGRVLRKRCLFAT